MKVLLVSTLEQGGPVEQTLVLAGALRDLGIEVNALVADAALAARCRTLGVPARAQPIAAGADFVGAARLWRAMRTADVVHAQDRRAGLWTRLAPGLPRVARVYTVHGLPDPYMPPPLGPGRPHLRDRVAYEIVDAGLSRRVDALITPSSALARLLTSEVGFDARLLEVVPNGIVELPRLARRGDAIGTLSLLEPVKDLPTFLRAAALLHRNRPGLRFAIAGVGSQRNALRRLTNELLLDGVVDFTGHLPPEQALAGLAVLVHPSIMENAPMAILEAMSAGVPVVASRTGGIPELVGDTALLAEPGDASAFAASVERLLANPVLAQRLADHARDRVSRRYTAQANAEMTLSVYETALRRRRERAQDRSAAPS